MKSSYDILGNHIRLVDYRNRDLVSDKVLGINIDKYFMPSVANVIGTDLSKYKLISKGLFACNPMHVGRDERLPVALYTDDTPAIVSPAYFMFEVIDNTKLNEEFLMMWFRRPEFDRICWLKTDGSVRGGITWEDICRIELPVPPFEEQLKIVSSYKAITDRIALKQRINDNLDAQRNCLFTELYTKSENNDVPNGWHYRTLDELKCIITDYVANGSFQSLADNVEYQEEDTGNVLIRLTDYNNNFTGRFIFVTNEAYDFLSKSKLYGGEIIIANVGVNVGTTFRCPSLKYRMSLAPNSIMIRDEQYQDYLYAFFKSTIGQKALQGIVTGSAQPKFNKTSLRKLQIAFPDDDNVLSGLIRMSKEISMLQERNNQELRSLIQLQNVLLQELSC